MANVSLFSAASAGSVVDDAPPEAVPEAAILSVVLTKDKKERGTNHSFYLSPDVTAALARLSKKTKKSKSTLVNGILGEVLLKS